MFTSSLRLTSRVCLVPAFQFVLESHTNRTNGMWEMWKNACTICWCWCCVEYVAHCKSINIHRHTQAQLTHFTLILSFNFRKPKYNNMAAMELSSSFVHFARLLCFSLNRRIAAFSLSLFHCSHPYCGMLHVSHRNTIVFVWALAWFPLR